MSKLSEATFAGEPKVRAAFLEFVRRTTGAASVTELERALAAGDEEAAMAAIHMRASELSDLLETIRESYAQGGAYGAEAIRRAARAEFRFDVRSPRAEAWLRYQSSTRVTQIISEQRQNIRIVLESGARRGINPRQTALDIVGRINPATGRRAGGIVGLTSQQAEWVMRAREQLVSGDPEQLRQYLTRKLRDQRFDRAVLRAIETGERISETAAARITERYADRVLKMRGDTIARTETMQAFNAGRAHSYEQAFDDGVLRREHTKKIWSATMDARTREDHAEMDGAEVEWDEAFVSPTGARLMHPGDTDLGAGPEDIINCRCLMRVEVDFIGAALDA